MDLSLEIQSLDLGPWEVRQAQTLLGMASATHPPSLVPGRIRPSGPGLESYLRGFKQVSCCFVAARWVWRVLAGGRAPSLHRPSREDHCTAPAGCRSTGAHAVREMGALRYQWQVITPPLTVGSKTLTFLRVNITGSAGFNKQLMCTRPVVYSCDIAREAGQENTWKIGIVHCPNSSFSESSPGAHHSLRPTSGH
jgi:hypothetical protein